MGIGILFYSVWEGLKGVAEKGNGFVCVGVLRLSQPNRVMLSVVSLPNHNFTGQA